MRFMIIVKANQDSEAGVMPGAEVFEGMGSFNEDLIKAGVLLAAEGLQPSSMGVKVRSEKGRPRVIDGPFAEAKELIAGFWIVDVRSKDEAVAWATDLMHKVPFEDGEEIEIRKVFEASDFPADLVTEEQVAKEQAWRDANRKPVGA